MNLFFLSEIFTNNLSVILLDVLSVAATTFAIMVIITKNPINSVLCLIGLFLVISFILCSGGINFIGLSYILVYVGAVSILFLFILMLINIRISELLSETRNSIPLVIIVSCIFSIFLGSVLSFSDVLSMLAIQFIETQGWDNGLCTNNHITAIGNILYTSYSIWLLVTSIILLLAMVGVIVITLRPAGDGVYHKEIPSMQSIIGSELMDLFYTLAPLINLLEDTLSDLDYNDLEAAEESIGGAQYAASDITDSVERNFPAAVETVASVGEVIDSAAEAVRSAAAAAQVASDAANDAAVSAEDASAFSASAENSLTVAKASSTEALSAVKSAATKDYSS